MERLRLIPSIDTLQKDEVFEAILQEETVSKALLTKWLKVIVDDIRKQILNGEFPFHVKNERDFALIIMNWI